MFECFPFGAGRVSFFDNLFLVSREEWMRNDVAGRQACAPFWPPTVTYLAIDA